jgi:outer membrane lipoprotein SlyB
MKIPTRKLSTLTLFTALASGPALAQSVHRDAERAQTRSDHRHHTGAKIVGGSAAGGAVIGAVAGGGKGALIGGAVGAGGGAIANHVRKQNDVKKRERTGRY